MRHFRKTLLALAAFALVALPASPGRPMGSIFDPSDLVGTLEYTDVTGDENRLQYALVAALDSQGKALATAYTDAAGAFSLDLGFDIDEVESLSVASTTEHVRVEQCYPLTNRPDTDARELVQPAFTYDFTPSGFDPEAYASSPTPIAFVVPNKEMFGKDYYEFSALWVAQRLERAWLTTVGYLESHPTFPDAKPGDATLPTEAFVRVRYGCPGVTAAAVPQESPSWYVEYTLREYPGAWHERRLDWIVDHVAIDLDDLREGEKPTFVYNIVIPEKTDDPWNTHRYRSEYTLLHELGHVLNYLSGTDRVPDDAKASTWDEEHEDNVCESSSLVWEEATADMLAMTLDWGDLAPEEKRSWSASHNDELFLSAFTAAPDYPDEGSSPERQMMWDWFEVHDADGVVEPSYSRERHFTKARDDLFDADLGGGGTEQSVYGVASRGDSQLDRDCPAGEEVANSSVAWVRDLMDGKFPHDGEGVGATVSTADLPVDAGYAPDDALLFDDWESEVEPAALLTLLLDGSRQTETLSREAFCEYLVGAGVEKSALRELAHLNGMGTPCPSAS